MLVYILLEKRLEVHDGGVEVVVEQQQLGDHDRGLLMVGMQRQKPRQHLLRVVVRAQRHLPLRQRQHRVAALRMQTQRLFVEEQLIRGIILNLHSYCSNSILCVCLCVGVCVSYAGETTADIGRDLLLRMFGVG